MVVLPSGKLKSVARAKCDDHRQTIRALSGAELTKRLQAGGLANSRRRLPDHYAYLYACDEKFDRATRDILEPLYDGVMAALKQAEGRSARSASAAGLVIMPNRATFDARGSSTACRPK